jgi:hypothetical protein
MTRNIRQPAPANRIINTGLGQKGDPGERGQNGTHGQVTKVVFVAQSKSPGDLNGCIIPESWDQEGSPKYGLKVNTGESVVDSSDGSIWTYSSANKQGGWSKIGSISKELHTVSAPRGIKGDRGEKGNSGAHGRDGVKGERGATGLPGKAGADGKDGTNGLAGPRGSRGHDGLRGLEGAEGEKGSKGEPGLPGRGGFRGEKGGTGDKGERGREGSKGANGEVLNAHLLPAALCTYDAINKRISFSHNVSDVKALNGEGTHSFRMAKKFKSINTFVLAVAEGPGFYSARVVSQTDRVITVETYNLKTLELANCTVKLVVYDIRG